MLTWGRGAEAVSFGAALDRESNEILRRRVWVVREGFLEEECFSGALNDR